MSEQHPIIPHIRVPTQKLDDAGLTPRAALEDQDNFVRDLGTILVGGVAGFTTDTTPPPPVTPTPPVGSRGAVLSLEEVKIHCHIELDHTIEDDYLNQLEMAARLHAENYLRYKLEAPVGENIRQALLLLIASWYRRREAVTGESYRYTEVPMAFTALLALERDYPTYT